MTDVLTEKDALRLATDAKAIPFFPMAAEAENLRISSKFIVRTWRGSSQGLPLEAQRGSWLIAVGFFCLVKQYRRKKADEERQRRERQEYQMQNASQTKEEKPVKTAIIRFKGKAFAEFVLKEDTYGHQKLEDTVIEQITEYKRGLGRLSNRGEINEEQIGIVARKFEKERVRMSEVVTGFKKLEERKVDDRAIQQLRTAIKKIGKDLQEGLQSKASREVVERDRKGMLDRVQAMAESLGQKAQKVEVKRGLTFLEDKLKEVIIVLAEEKNYNKDSAVKKGAFKCLSCDKELQGSVPEHTLPPRMPRDSTASARGSTSNIRKRIRLVNNSINDDN